MSRLYFWNLSKACWMVGFALAAGLKSRLRTRETPPFSRKISLARSALPENGTKRKSPESFESTNNSRLSDAADGGRTRTLSPERDFKSLVSANFTTAAYNANNNTIEWLLCQEKAQSPSLHPPFTIHL